MGNNSSKIMFMSCVVVSTMISISSSTWLGAWMGLEINLLSFIPLMSDSNNLMSTESALKYFLTQALASSTLLFASLLAMISIKWMDAEMMSAPSLIISSSLLMKLGAAPFYFWFPLVVEGMTWTNTVILMTWQKLAPLVLISYTSTFMVLISAIASALVGSLGGLNQTSIRKLMAYSSINHLSWILASQYFSEMLWVNYFLIYCILVMAVGYSFMVLNVLSMNQMFSYFHLSPYLKISLSANLLSMGGLPPFLGFFPKWVSIQQFMADSQFITSLTLVMCSLITLFFYLRLCFSSFTHNCSEMNWHMNGMEMSLQVSLCLILSFISTFGLLIISLSYLLE